MRLRLRLAATAALALACAAPFAQAAPISVTILHNNDGESKLRPQPATGPNARTIGGVAPFTTLLRTLREAATTDAVLTLSSGDNFLAGTSFAASLRNGVLYDALALTRIDYDAIILGNHDFDFGPDFLARFVDEVENAPFLSANLDFSANAGLQALVDAGRIAPSTVIEKAGARFGIVGATTPLLPIISSPGDVVTNPDVAGVVQAEIDRLTAAGVENIIFVSHLQSVNEDRALLAQLRGVDVAIAGGGDDLLANPGDPLIPGETRVGPYPTTVRGADGIDVPIVTTAGEYKYVGKLVVDFENGRATVRPAESGPVRVLAGDPNTTPDAELQRTVVDPVAAYEAALGANVIARSDAPLNGLRTDIRTRETNLGNLVADAYLWQAQELAAAFGVEAPVIAFSNGGGIRNNSVIAAGNFTELNTFDILPFGNFLSIIEDVPVDVLLGVLENAVSRVEFVDGRFLQVSGFRFRYDALRRPGDRVIDVVLEDGTVLVMNGDVAIGSPAAITLATSAFTANGGDGFNFFGRPFTTLGVTDQQTLFNFISTELNGTITGYAPGGEGRILQIPVPGALALLAGGAAGLVTLRRRRAA